MLLKSDSLWCHFHFVGRPSATKDAHALPGSSWSFSRQSTNAAELPKLCSTDDSPLEGQAAECHQLSHVLCALSDCHMGVLQMVLPLSNYIRLWVLWVMSLMLALHSNLQVMPDCKYSNVFHWIASSKTSVPESETFLVGHRKHS